MRRNGPALIAVVVLGLSCLGAAANGESFCDEQRTAETGHQDESPHTVHFISVDSDVKLEVRDWGPKSFAILAFRPGL
jgi:hypothetical protein